MSTPCPDCGAPLTGDPSCSSCGLSVTGPVAGRLWVVDQQLATLARERSVLLEQLRPGAVPPSTPSQPAQPTWATPPARPRETTPHTAQNTLLGLGALLLAGAGLVFAAVTYNHLGVTGRAAVLVALTVAAFGAAQALVRRGLASSGEAVAAVGVVLSVVDAWAARRAGLGDGTSPEAYAAVASAVLALLTGAVAQVVPLRVTRLATVVLAQGPLLFALDAGDASATTAALLLALLVAADVAAAERPVPRDVRIALRAFGGLWSVATLAAAGAAFADGQRGGAGGVLVLVGVAAAAAVRLPDGELREGAALSVPPLLAFAAWGATRADLTTAQQPLVLVAVGLLALQAVAVLPSGRRVGAVAGALLVSGAAVVAEGEGVLQALVGPLSWIGDPWSLRADRARDAVLAAPWDGSVVTLVALAAAAVAALGAGLLLDRLRQSIVPAAVLLGAAAVVLPLGLDTSYHVALLLQVAVAVSLCAAGSRLLPLALAGLGLLGLSTAWSLAEQDATLAVVPVAAVVAAALSVRLPGVLTAAALGLAGGELAAVAVARGAATDQVGALLLVAPAIGVALSFVLRGHHRVGVEGGAALTGAVAIGLTATDAGWLTWSLAIAGLLALAVAVRADRRAVGYAGALLLAGSSWVRLADADVTAPEPYVLPLAAMTLVLGHLRRRAHPAMGSFEAYAGGLVLGLLPSLLKSLDDATPTRGLLVLVAGALVVLVGARERLRAPLVVGGTAVVVEVLQLLGPYAAALPRWLVLAAAGALLVAVGVTYEQRLRDVQRLRQHYESWA